MNLSVGLVFVTLARYAGQRFPGGRRLRAPTCLRNRAVNQNVDLAFGLHPVFSAHSDEPLRDRQARPVPRSSGSSTLPPA